MQKPMFLRWRRHRSRKSAISKIPSYINPAQNHEAQNTCWRRLPQQPQFPQGHSPSRLLKQKSVCFHMSSNSRIKPRGPRLRDTQKHETKNTCWRRLPQPHSHTCHSPARFLWQKACVFACSRIPESKPEVTGAGPRLQGPGSRLQGSRAEAPGLRAQAPSSKI